MDSYFTCGEPFIYFDSKHFAVSRFFLIMEIGNNMAMFMYDIWAIIMLLTQSCMVWFVSKFLQGCNHHKHDDDDDKYNSSN